MNNFDEKSIIAVRQALNCTEEEAELIVEPMTYVDNKISFPITAVKDENEQNNSIIITDSNNKRFFVGIGADYYVYSIKDAESGKYIFAVMQ